MSIELLQTMEWSRLCWDQCSEAIIDLGTILPEIGTTYPVKFARNEDFAENGVAFLLWQPPHSELNGWRDKRPSEILKSYVIEGSLKRSRSDSATFDFIVLGCNKLVELFAEIDEEKRSPLSYIGQPGGSTILQWGNASQLRKSWIGHYLYLAGSECETLLDAILTYEGNGMCLHYSATLHNPAHYQTVITKYYLSNDERVVFNRLLTQAEEIPDDSMLYLNENQINGAEYW